MKQQVYGQVAVDINSIEWTVSIRRYCQQEHRAIWIGVSRTNIFNHPYLSGRFWNEDDYLIKVQKSPIKC